MSSPAKVCGLFMTLLVLGLALPTSTFADGPSTTMNVSVTVEPSCLVTVGGLQELSLRCAAALAGRAQPRIEVATSPVVPAAMTQEESFSDSGLLVINF